MNMNTSIGYFSSPVSYDLSNSKLQENMETCNREAEHTILHWHSSRVHEWQRTWSGDVVRNNLPLLGFESASFRLWRRNAILFIKSAGFELVLGSEIRSLFLKYKFKNYTCLLQPTKVWIVEICKSYMVQFTVT